MGNEPHQRFFLRQDMHTPADPRSEKTLAYSCLALSMVLVGSYVALSKPLAAAFPVFLLAWMRFGIGVVAMLHWLKPPAPASRLSSQVHLLIFLEAFFGNFLFTLCMIYGVKLTSATAAGVSMAAIPAVVAAMGWWFLKERISPKTWLAVACAVAGILLFFAAKPTLAPAVPELAVRMFWGFDLHAWTGQLLLVGAVFCEAAYSVIGKKLATLVSPRRIASLINVWGFALATPLGLYAAASFDFAAVDLQMWSLLLFYALAASVWSVWLWMTGLRKVDAAQAGVFTIFLPVSAALVGVAMLGESLAPLQWAAFSIALSSVLFATIPSKRQISFRKNQKKP